MSTTEAERILARRVGQLIKSPARNDRKKANEIGSIVGNWRRGRMGDSSLITAAQEAR